MAENGNESSEHAVHGGVEKRVPARRVPRMLQKRVGARPGRRATRGEAKRENGRGVLTYSGKEAATAGAKEREHVGPESSDSS